MLLNMARFTPASDEAVDKKKVDYQKLAKDFITDQEYRFRYYHGRYLEYQGTHFVEREPEFLTIQLRRWLLKNKVPHNNTLVGNVAESVKAIVAVDPNQEIPCFVGKGEWPDPKNIIAFENGLLDLGSFLGGEPRLLKHTCNWVSTSCLPYPYDPQAQCPTWEGFLAASLEGDREKVTLLRQWFGYCLGWDTSLQKMVFLVGPPRAGKGTTSRVLQKLVGERNYTAYNLWKLAENFGLAPLVGKQVAFVGEINLAGAQKKHQILEQLNSIVGGDPVSVNAKHRDEYTVFLPTRFTFNCNEMPAFFDTTGAFAARLLVVEFNTSFAGREDADLDRKLAAEVPGIANWALAGLADLRRAGRFTVTERLNEAVVAVQREASTPLAFAQDCLVVEEFYHNPSLPKVRTSTDHLWAKKEAVWQAYIQWCGENCRELGSRVWFFRDLRALLPKLSKDRDKKVIDGKEVEVVRGVAVASPPGT